MELWKGEERFNFFQKKYKILKGSQVFSKQSTIHTFVIQNEERSVILWSSLSVLTTVALLTTYSTFFCSGVFSSQTLHDPHHTWARQFAKIKQVSLALRQGSANFNCRKLHCKDISLGGFIVSVVSTQLCSITQNYP